MYIYAVAVKMEGHQAYPYSQNETQIYRNGDGQPTQEDDNKDVCVSQEDDAAEYHR